MEVNKKLDEAISKTLDRYCSFNLAVILGLLTFACISAAITGLVLEAQGMVDSGSVNKLFSLIFFYDKDSEVDFFLNSIVVAISLFFLISFVVQTLKNKQLNQLLLALMSAFAFFSLPMIVGVSYGGVLLQKVPFLMPLLCLVTLALFVYQCVYLIKINRKVL